MLPSSINEIKRCMYIPIKKIRQFFMPEFVCSPQGWVHKPKSAGWNDKSIAKAQKARWESIVNSLQGSGPLTTAYTYISPELTKNDLAAQNTIMSYAYILALTARKRDTISLLDWGGGVGLYRLLSKILFPEMNIEYYCYDTPMLCSLGRELLSDGIFFEDAEAALSRRYDLVLSSSSLHYCERWQEVFAQLAKAAIRYLYIARLPVVQNVGSFVEVQKCYQNKIYGYNTEFTSWVIDRRELLKIARQSGMNIIREFLYGETRFIHKAPENPEVRGFLFGSKR